MKKTWESENFKRRLLMCVLGVVICGISVGFFKRAAFGLDPFQSFMAGLHTAIPVPFGRLYIVACIILLLFSLFTDRHYAGLATLINLFLTGYIIDYSQEILFRVFPTLGITGRVVFLVVGVIVMCLSCSLYMTADLGVSVYDAVALIITQTWHKGQFRWVRILTDAVCVVMGGLLFFCGGGSLSELGAQIGIGTIVTALFMGPLIDFFNRKVSQPLLNYGK